MSGSQFGLYLRNRRVDLNLTLREFSRMTGYDASNLSKIERGVIPPPPVVMLKAWAKHLRLKPGTNDYEDFINLSLISKNRIPDDTPEVVRSKLLPALFRTQGSKKLTKEEYRRLVKLLND